MKRIRHLSGIAVASLLLVACTKPPHDCYDHKLYKKFRDKVCTADCPGVEGCDGNFYCNECEANRHGIRVIH